MHSVGFFIKVFKLNLGRWAKALSEDRVTLRCRLMRARHVCMLGIHVIKDLDSWINT